MPVPKKPCPVCLREIPHYQELCYRCVDMREKYDPTPTCVKCGNSLPWEYSVPYCLHCGTEFKERER